MSGAVMSGVAVRSGLKHSAPEQRKAFLKSLQEILCKKPSEERVQAWLAQVRDRSIGIANELESRTHGNAKINHGLIYHR